MVCLHQGAGLKEGQPRISTVIMTHPRRYKYAESLRERCNELNPSIVVDPEPNAPPWPLRTARLAWEAVDPAATHHLVLQDDAMPCDNFHQEILAALKSKPHAALALFAHWGSHLSYAIRLTALCQLSWTKVIGPYMPTVAILVPADIARDIAKFLRQSGARHDDEVILDYLNNAGIDALASIPNLFEHLDLPSIAGHDSVGIRQPTCFLRQGRDSPQWTEAVLQPTALPYMPQETGRALCYIHDGSTGLGGYYLQASGLLEQRHLNSKNLHETFTAYLRDMDKECSLVNGIGSFLLHELWISASLLGVLVCDQCPSQISPEKLATAVSSPLARVALSTMGVGALRTLIPLSDLVELTPQLSALVEAGVRYGISCMGITTFH
jgi:hypothetical protein